MTGLTDLEIPYPTGSDTVGSGDIAIKAAIDRINFLMPRTLIAKFPKTINNSDTLDDDDVLLFEVAEDVDYDFEFYLIFSAGSSAIDAQVALKFPAASVCTWGVVALDPAAGAFSIGDVKMECLVEATSGDGITVGVSAGHTGVLIKGTIEVTTPGFVELKWAQDTQTADDLVREAGSKVSWAPAVSS